LLFPIFELFKVSVSKHAVLETYLERNLPGLVAVIS